MNFDSTNLDGTGSQPVINHSQDERGIAKIQKCQGAYLPHWTRDTSIYSVTFRLVGSVPESVAKIWRAEREEIIATVKKMDSALSEAEKRRLQYLFSEKVDAYLDAGHGPCWLLQKPIAKLVSDAMRYFDAKRYRLFAWCIMPNHVHAVLQPLPGYELPGILHSWKSYTATMANKILERNGDFWQPEYYDHVIRNEEDLIHAVRYVLENPIKAGMKNWLWVGSMSF